MSFGEGNLRGRIDHLEEVNGYLCAEINRQERVIERQAERIRELESLVTAEEIAATLGDGDYELKMDELLCRLTNGRWSKSRSYSVDFMVGCVDEAYEDAMLGGKLTAEQVRKCVRVGACDHGLWGALDEDTDWQTIADELNAAMGGGKAVKR